jgi:hypothetical protein
MREDLAANAAILKRLAGIDKTLLLHDAAPRGTCQKLRPLPGQRPDPFQPRAKERSDCRPGWPATKDRSER